MCVCMCMHVCLKESSSCSSRRFSLHCMLCADKGKVVIGLDSKNWFAFEVSMNLADLLQCGRQALHSTLNAGLKGRLGRLTPAHREFLRGLNRFLVANTLSDM